MSDPTTTNVLLSIPARGSDVGTWDVPINGDFAALDGYLGGVQTIGLASTNVTLTAPTGIVTPSAGPTQAQNAVLKFTGAISSSLTVFLPLPGYYIIDNQATTSNNSLVLIQSTALGKKICVDFGDTMHVYCDGTDVKFVNMGRLAHVEIWASYSAMPGWVTNCTVPPYLLCDGTVYNISSFPYLGARLGSTFGGNGSTTFGVPDLRGRMALPYDGTGARITAAVCGINGQVIGASGDLQGVTLVAGQIPTISSVGNNTITVNSTTPNILLSDQVATIAGVGGSNPVKLFSQFTNQSNTTPVTSSASNTISVSSNNTGGQVHSNVQPSLVTGIAVIRSY